MRESLLQELVPLQEAAAIVHHVLSDPNRSRLAAQDVLRLRRETALALGALAHILERCDGQSRLLTLEELEAYLRGANSALSRLYVRRAELIRAIDLLKAGKA
jgi:hypothetical protein